MSTRQTLNMLVRSAWTSVGDSDRDEELARTAARLAATGPFKSKLFVAADLERAPLEVLATAGIDDARSTRLVVLDPCQFSLLNGIDKQTRSAVRAAMGIGPDKLPVQWASSAVFAIINTQRRSQARGAAGSYLAWERVAAMDAVRGDEELARGRPGVADSATREQELAFTLMCSLTDETRRDNVRLLLRSLANAIDAGRASYAQMMVKIIVDASVADGIAEDIRMAGTTPTVRRSDSPSEFELPRRATR